MWLFSPTQREVKPEETKSAGDAAAAPGLTTVVSNGRPRGKALANKPKLLPRWESCSDDEREAAPDEGSDYGDAVSPSNSMAQLSAAVSRDESFADQSDAPVSPAAAAVVPVQRKVLPSYETRVLQLHAKKIKKVEDSDDSDDSDEENKKDPAAIRAQQLKQQQMLKHREKMLEEEKLHKAAELESNTSRGMNAVSASRVIVGVARVKLGMMKQRMKVFEEAEEQGTQGNLRARRILEWTAILSFLKRFDKVMSTPNIMKIKTEVYLNSLPPPPPPPPIEDPPDAEDQELHEKYEAMIRKYETQWRTEGQRVLGIEKFEEIRNMRNGPAAREKKEIARARLDKAHQVLDEAQHQELLRQAWRLGDDHMALSEYNPVEFARQHANSDKKKGSAEAKSAASKSAGNTGSKK